jgi:hypothetical protein
MLAFALLIAATPIEPINLDNLGTRRARTLDGKRHSCCLLLGKPSYTLCGSTIIGTDYLNSLLARASLRE